MEIGSDNFRKKCCDLALWGFGKVPAIKERLDKNMSLL